MSLKVEERLDETFLKTYPKNRIFTTGAHLMPMEVVSNGKKRFVWVVDSFEDDSYQNGEVCNPQEYADNPDKLIQDFD